MKFKFGGKSAPGKSTKRAGRSKGGSRADSTATRLAIIVALCISGLVAGGVASTFMVGEDAVFEQIRSELRRVHTAQALLQQRSLSRLEIAAESLAERNFYAETLRSEKLRAEEAEADDARSAATREEDEESARALQEVLDTRMEQHRAHLELDAAFLFSFEGEVLAVAASDALALDPTDLADLAPDGENVDDPQVFRGVRLFGETPAEFVVRPLVREFELIGAVGVASGLGPRALEIHRITGSETALLVSTPTGPTAIADTLEGGPDLLISQLRLQGQALGRVLDSGQTVEDVELTLGEEARLGFLTPVRFESDAPAGALVALMPYKERFSGLLLVRGVLLGLGLIVLIVGVVLTAGAAKASMMPLKRLEEAVDQAAAGDLDVAIPVRSGAFGGLGRGIQLLIDRTERRRRLQGFLSQAARRLPEAVAPLPQTPPTARQLALVMVEMRRYANPKIGYDPGEHMARYARDLRRITGVVSHRNGRVEALLGHRSLVAFEGDNCVWHALCAATEILLLLSTRENAFDEPEPPVVALGGGPVASASMNWDGRTALATAGVPIQQLESLVREAAPGEIYLSKPIYDALAAIFQQRNVQVRSQRGLVSPQPILALSAEAAAQLTGVPQPSDSRAVQENLDQEELTPGTLIADRFEIIAKLGSGPFGTTFKARDRNRSDFVALRILQAQAVAQEETKERLRDSLRRAKMLQATSLLGALDSGEAFGGIYVTRPFVRAMSLRHVLEGGKVPVVESFLLAQQICAGLVAAHQQGAVHGHLRPENILVETTGDVRLVDFGISTALHIEMIQEPYNAPESVGHRTTPEPRGDVYSLGVVLTEMLIGEPPAFGATADQVRQQIREADEGEIPGELEDLIATCFATPDARPEAQGLLQDFIALGG